MENETTITLTADIVSAHVNNNSVTVADLPALIQSVFAALANLEQPAPVVEEKREPGYRSAPRSNPIRLPASSAASGSRC